MSNCEISYVSGVSDNVAYDHVAVVTSCVATLVCHHVETIMQINCKYI